MKHSLALVRILEDQGRSSRAGHFWDDGVFSQSKPDVVSHVYREHLETYYVWGQTKTSFKNAWYKAVSWLRGLERRCRHRVFHKEPQLDLAWWDKHVRTIISRKATTIRITLPLEDEIKLFMQVLRPHFVAWILGLVDLKKLELCMYPKTVLQALYVQIRQEGPSHFEALTKDVKRLYPDIAGPIRRKDFEEAYYPCRLSHWPGLRFRPPFFPDLAQLHPAPSTTLPYQGKYLVVSATLQDSVAKASIVDFQTAVLDELQIQNHGFHPSIGVKVSNDTPSILETLLSLDKVHPRSFRYDDPKSPFAKAATVLTPMVSFAIDAVQLPENAVQGFELGFSFTYMMPKHMGGMPPFSKEEEFYEVKVDNDRYVHLSSYVGFGLRMRHTVLQHTKHNEMQNQGVCIVVPDGLLQEKTENIMLTSIAFLQGLGLRDLKLLSENTCHAACLGSVAALRQGDSSTSWASFHDGSLVCQAIGVVFQNGKVKDLWQKQENKYSVSPLKELLLGKLRDFIFGHPKVVETVEASDGHRFARRAAVVEAIRAQIPSIIDHLERHLLDDGASTTVTLNLSTTGTSEDMASIDLGVSKDVFESWVDQCFIHLKNQAWWNELQTNLEQCTGVLVSGGLFQCCPRTAMQALHRVLTPRATAFTKPSRLNMLHGACLVIYREKGCRHLLLSVDDPNGLPITSK